MHKVPNLLTRARLFRQKNRIMHQKAWVRCSKLGIISSQKLTQFWYFGSAAAARCKTYSERASVTSRVIWKIQKCKINCGTHKMSDRDNSFVMVMACLCQQKIPELISSAYNFITVPVGQLGFSAHGHGCKTVFISNTSWYLLFCIMLFNNVADQMGKTLAWPLSSSFLTQHRTRSLAILVFKYSCR